MPVCGLGVDLLEKRRLNGWIERPGVRRRFAAEEIVYAEQGGRAAEALAAAFAAKEAFYKAASGLLLADYELPEVQAMFWQAHLHRLADGRPQIVLQEPLAGRLRAAGVRQILVSISHDREQVLAAVLLLNDSGQADEAVRILRGLQPPGFEELENDNVSSEITTLDADWAAKVLPIRSPAAHQGNFGRVLVVGGSARYVGAAQLAAEAALRGGAGLVTLAAPWHIQPLSPEIMRLPLAAPAGYIAGDRLPVLQQALRATSRDDKQVLAVGMGLGREPETCQLVRSLSQLACPKVIDADGLFALAEEPQPVPGAVLTPHSGEMARLLSAVCDYEWTAADVEARRLEAVQLCAEKYQAVVVLKGQHTLVCAPSAPGAVGERRLFMNTSGNPGMATGGSGDVLAGLIASWLAQGLADWQAAAFAVYLHGLAGDLAAQAKSQYAMTALDIVQYLPAAYNYILNRK